LPAEAAGLPERVSVALMHGLSVVMPGLVPGTHVFRATKQDVGGRDKPGHDALGEVSSNITNFLKTD
jgi:hypothetical protein